MPRRLRGVVHLGDLRVARQDRVDQRAARIARAGMHDQPGGLVDHGEVVVFVDDVERDRLRLDAVIFDGRRHGDGDLLAALELDAGLTTAPSTVTRPSRMSACTCVRVSRSPRCAAMILSSRSPGEIGCEFDMLVIDAERHLNAN